jgi:hypothetical protein
LSSWVVISAKPISITTAAPRPSTIARRRWCGGRPAAESPTAMALSPRQREVDQHDLDEGGQGAGGRKREVHRASMGHVAGARNSRGRPNLI